MEKEAVRDRIWDALEAEGIARFPFPPHDRIPNFAGADDAAERLADSPEWNAAETVKANPDAPQLPVRRAALRAGKTLYVAQPRLRDEQPFLELDPSEVDDVDDATTVSGISTHGTPVGPNDVDHVDLVVSGSVAVTEQGARIGKGEGYSDLEWALLREIDAVDAGTTVATTVHERQTVAGDGDSVATGDGDENDEPVAPDPDAHDVPMDLIVTAERTIRTETPYDRPTGVDWDALDDERLAEIPVLAAKAPDR